MSTEIHIDGPVSDRVSLPFEIVVQPTLTFFKPIAAPTPEKPPGSLFIDRGSRRVSCDLCGDFAPAVSPEGDYLYPGRFRVPVHEGGPERVCIFEAKQAKIRPITLSYRYRLSIPREAGTGIEPVQWRPRILYLSRFSVFENFF
jgi:hypothetical protein